MKVGTSVRDCEFLRARWERCELPLAAMLASLRLWFPTEAPTSADSLWLAIVWIVVGAVFCGAAAIVPAALANNDRSKGTGSTADTRTSYDRWMHHGVAWSVGLWLIGHLLNAAIGPFRGGDLSALFNLGVQWVGLTVTWWCFNRWAGCATWRAGVTAVLMTTILTQSSLAIWQRYVTYPALVSEFQPLFNELRSLKNDGAGEPTNVAARTSDRARRIQELERKLAASGVPLDDRSRELFERRLIDSREPFGPFALANTLAGLLASSLTAWLGLWIGLATTVLGIRRAAKTADAVPSGKPTHRFAVAGATAASAATAFALLLTKSRSAWAGAIVGAASVVWQGKHAVLGPRQQIVAGAAGVAAVAIGLGAGTSFGLLDREVWTEATKSLSYRAQYWTGAWNLLSQSPVWGAGLGQFRDRYLAHKLPESSEEIADPHNALIDAWSNGGLISLIGLSGVYLLTMLAVVRARRSSDEPPPSGVLDRWLSWGAVTLPAIFLGQWAIAGLFDDRAAVLAVVWGLLACLVRKTGVASFGSTVALTLLIHLLAAGGSEMPAVVQVVLWSLAVLRHSESGSESLDASMEPDATKSLPNGVSPAPKTSGRRVAAGLACGACVLTAGAAMRPVMAHLQIQAADDAALQGRIALAMSQYQEAARWEPWSHAARARMAELSARSWVASPTRDWDRVESILAEYRAAQGLRPDFYSLYAAEAALHRQLAERRPVNSPERSDQWRQAVAAQRAAVERNPGDSALWANLAELEFRAGEFERAEASARRALAQDDLNHARGHRERWLPSRIREFWSSGAAQRDTAGLPPIVE